MKNKNSHSSKTRFHALCVQILLLAALFFSSAQAQEKNYVPGQVIVKLKPNIVDFPSGVKRLPLSSVAFNSEALRDELSRRGTGEIEKVFETKAAGDTIGVHLRTGAPVRIIDQSQVFVVILPETADIKAAVEKLESLPVVAYAHPNYVAKITGSVPNDDPSGQYMLFQSSDKDVDAYDASKTSAWDITTGSSNVKIGIIDTGIEHTLADLGGSIGSSSKVLDGWYRTGLTDTQDIHGHGTAVASIAAALTNNGTGMAGVAGGWGGISQNMGARLIPLRTSEYGNPSVYTLATAVNKAVEKGADMINISIATQKNNTLNQSCYNAFAQGAWIVAAMGNNGNSTTLYPAGLGGKDDGGFVMAVGATDNSDNLWVSSNTGDHIDFVGPGVAIKSLNHNNNIGNWTGTSFSAPIVSGIAALLLSYNANLTDQDIKELISRSADKVDDMQGADWTDEFGWGRVNALKALQKLQSPNTLTHVTVSGGMSSQLMWDTHTHSFFSWYGSNDLSTGAYSVKQYRVSKQISFSVSYSEPPEVWARMIGTTGWDDSNPNYQKPHINISNVTGTGCMVETYVYEVWTSSGQYVGFRPAAAKSAITAVEFVDHQCRAGGAERTVGLERKFECDFVQNLSLLHQFRAKLQLFVRRHDNEHELHRRRSRDSFERAVG